MQIKCYKKVVSFVLKVENLYIPNLLKNCEVNSYYCYYNT